jgi:hypothetical protein
LYSAFQRNSLSTFSSVAPAALSKAAFDRNFIKQMQLLQRLDAGLV